MLIDECEMNNRQLESVVYYSGLYATSSEEGTGRPKCRVICKELTQFGNSFYESLSMAAGTLEIAVPGQSGRNADEGSHQIPKTGPHSTAAS